VAAAVRGAVQVDGGSQEHVDALAPGLGGEQPPDALHPVRVPTRRERGRRRDVGRRVPLVEERATHAGGAVGEHQFAQPDRRFRRHPPRVDAGEQANLLLQGQGVETGDRHRSIIGGGRDLAPRM
jgi:hypothetical protein